MKILSVSFGYPNNDDRVKRIFTHEQSKAIKAQGAEITVLDLNSEYFSDFENFESIMVFRSKNLRKEYKAWSVPFNHRCNKRVFKYKK